MPAVLSATTFCTLVREFSPLEMCAGETKKVLLGGFRGRGDGRVGVELNRRHLGDDDFHVTAADAVSAPFAVVD